MPDVSFLSDRGNAFEKTFTEYGYTCQQVVPPAFGSPFSPPSKLLIIPSGFADKKYYKLLPALERCASQIKTFIENGGIVLAFGAMLTDYTYDWLPIKLSYHMRFKTQNVTLVDPKDPAALLVEPGEKDCDGFFTEYDGNVVMKRRGRKAGAGLQKIWRRLYHRSGAARISLEAVSRLGVRKRTETHQHLG